MGKLDLDQTFTTRSEVNELLLKELDEATDPWGVKVTRVEMRDINPSPGVKQAMENDAALVFGDDAVGELAAARQRAETKFTLDAMRELKGGGALSDTLIDQSILIDDDGDVTQVLMNYNALRHKPFAAVRPFIDEAILTGKRPALMQAMEQGLIANAKNKADNPIEWGASEAQVPYAMFDAAQPGWVSPDMIDQRIEAHGYAKAAVGRDDLPFFDQQEIDGFISAWQGADSLLEMTNIVQGLSVMPPDMQDEAMQRLRQSRKGAQVALLTPRLMANTPMANLILEGKALSFDENSKSKNLSRLEVSPSQVGDYLPYFGQVDRQAVGDLLRYADIALQSRGEDVQEIDDMMRQFFSYGANGGVIEIDDNKVVVPKMATPVQFQYFLEEFGKDDLAAFGFTSDADGGAEALIDYISQATPVYLGDGRYEFHLNNIALKTKGGAPVVLDTRKVDFSGLDVPELPDGANAVAEAVASGENGQRKRGDK